MGMKLITNQIKTGSPSSFEDFVQKYRDEHQVKTASVKVAEEKDEAESSGQLKVEPLHQEGESTTMPKAGPSAKKDDGEKSAASVSKDENDKEGPDSGQPKAEGSEKLTNNVKFDPNDSSDEEKGIDASAGTETKVAASKCDECGKGCDECSCEDCKCAGCTSHTKTAALEDLPQEVQDKIKGKSSDDSGEEKDDKKDEDDKEEKEAKVEEDDKEEKEAKVEEDDKEEKEASKAPQFFKVASIDDNQKAILTIRMAHNLIGTLGKERTKEYISAMLGDVKFANLDSKNKSFLTEYWRQLFGDDYVADMVADK